MIRRRTRRGVGYCIQEKCDDVHNGVFLLNQGQEFFCPCCRAAGLVKEEQGRGAGNSEFWKEVRVYWRYDAKQRRYRCTSIIKDEAILGEHNVYHYWSPMIGTEKRAMAIAEKMLANLQVHSTVEEGEIPDQMETMISFDKPMESFRYDLRRVATTWEGLKASRLPTHSVENDDD